MSSLFETNDYAVFVADIPEKNRKGYIVENKRTGVQETYAFIMAEAFTIAVMLQQALDGKQWEKIAEQGEQPFAPPPLIFQ